MCWWHQVASIITPSKSLLVTDYRIFNTTGSQRRLQAETIDKSIHVRTRSEAELRLFFSGVQGG